MNELTSIILMALGLSTFLVGIIHLIKIYWGQ